MKRPLCGPMLACALAGVLSGSLVVACSSSSTGDDATQPGSGAGVDLPRVPIEDGGTTTPTPATATGDANCGSTTSELTKKPADLLLVLDRSSSMTRAMDSSDNCDVGSSRCSQRWATMITSLSTVLSSSSAEVHWGLKFFTTPSTATGGSTNHNSSGSCNVSSGVEVAVGSNNANAIVTQINQAGTASYTPTRLAIEAAAAYLNTVNDGNPKYILLASDGEPNCAPGSSGAGSSDLAGTVTAIQNAAAAGYKVFVIGVGPETGNLTDLAVAGGTDHFYPATTPAELSNALSTIAGTVAAGCTYQIGAAPADPNAIGVYLDKSLVPQSSTEGWSYDVGNTSITIHGSFCNDLTNGKKTLVEIFLPCKVNDPIPPVIL